MRYAIVSLAWLTLSTIAQADDANASRSAENAAIDRGLAFLAKDAWAWKAEHNCNSCHHAALVVWAMQEAKQRSFVVDEALLTDHTKWIAESGEGKTGVPRPANIPKAINAKAIYYAFALAADPAPDEVTQTGLKRMLSTVKGDQLETGAWAWWPETRPPIFGNSDESMTVLASLALQPAAAAGEEEAKAALEKGIEWLRQMKSDDDPQTLAMRVVLWRRAGRPVEETAPLVQKIRANQNSDGGWRQAPDMASDAWATGQALYALACADLAPDDPSVARGRQFLVATQKEDGSWPMTSRPIQPGSAGSSSLIPITGGGSAWGVLGLVRSGPPRSSTE